MKTGDRRQYADQILNAINYGRLPKNEIERRLQKIINEELSGSFNAEYNSEKVALCNALLWQLYTHGEIQIYDQGAALAGRVECSYSKYKKRKKRLFRVLGTASIMILVVVCLTALKVISPVQWFTVKSINDGQQYLVEGHTVNVGTIAEAIAEHNETGISQISTGALAELQRFLGFDPGLPMSLQSTYLPVRYDGIVDATSIRVTAYYEDPAETSESTPLLSVRIIMAVSMDDIEIPFEQDNEGERINLGGVSVYRFSNVWTVNYLWEEEHTLVRIVTDFSYDTADTIAEEVITWRRGK